MTRKREKLQAYFAGLFDGEGTVGVYYTSNAWRLALGIGMTDPLGVGLMWREYPEATFKEIHQPEKKNTFKFNLYGETARRFLEDIKPYTILKQDQIKLGLAFLNYTSRYRANRRRNNLPQNAPYPKHFHDRAKSFSDKLKDAKNYIGVNSVETWSNKSRQYRAELVEAELDSKLIREQLEGVETKHSESVEANERP